MGGPRRRQAKRDREYLRKFKPQSEARQTRLLDTLERIFRARMLSWGNTRQGYALP